jgi:hypothetical protein
MSITVTLLSPLLWVTCVCLSRFVELCLDKTEAVEADRARPLLISRDTRLWSFFGRPIQFQ